MKVLVVGGGGREHALAWKCAQSPRVGEVLVAPGNAGTAREPRMRNVAVAADDVPGLVALARAEGVAEPEDHIAFLCETLAGLIEGRFGDPAEADTFFQRHLRPWAARFFADLEGARAARFYRLVGALGRVAIEIEQAAVELPQ